MGIEMKKLLYIEDKNAVNGLDLERIPFNYIVALEFTDLRDQLEGCRFQELIIFSKKRDDRLERTFLNSLQTPLPDIIIFKESRYLSKYL